MPIHPAGSKVSGWREYELASHHPRTLFLRRDMPTW